MFTAIRRWVEHRRAIRRRWQADARRLILAEEVNAHHEAQCRATRARACKVTRASSITGPRSPPRSAGSRRRRRWILDAVRAIVAEETGIFRNTRLECQNREGEYAD
jgi:hypothetical protein